MLSVTEYLCAYICNLASNRVLAPKKSLWEEPFVQKNLLFMRIYLTDQKVLWTRTQWSLNPSTHRSISAYQRFLRFLVYLAYITNKFCNVLLFPVYNRSFYCIDSTRVEGVMEDENSGRGDVNWGKQGIIIKAFATAWPIALRALHSVTLRLYELNQGESIFILLIYEV